MNGTTAHPGWYPDPIGRHEYRYWDGTTWTEQVADHGATGTDPLDAMPPPTPTPAPTPAVTVPVAAEPPAAGTPLPPPDWPLPTPAPTPSGSGRRRVVVGILVGVAVVAIATGLVVALASNDSGRSYPKFCATAAKLDPLAGDAATVVANAATVAQTLKEIEQLPDSQRPSGAAEAAENLRAQLGGWMVGGGYDSDFKPLGSAVVKWKASADAFRSVVSDSCNTSASKFFASGGPQAPTTTSPPRSVAGWAIPGIRTLCVNTDASFAGTALTREQVLDQAGLASATDTNVSSLKNRRIFVVDPGQACDATLTIAFTGTALSGDYSGGGTLYTGADMNGTLTLSAPGQPDLVFGLSKHDEPPFTTFENPASLPKTPMDALHHIGLRTQVDAALTQWFGAA